MKNIVLIGFMGSGKSMVSKILAERLDREVVSTDAQVERVENRTIPEIFTESGEEYFRNIEKRVVSEVSQKQGVIIDCGGGVVLDEENVGNLQKNGTVFYLKASPECLLEQVKQSGGRRPLLEVDDPLGMIKELLDIRTPMYEKADIIIDADKTTVPIIAERILEKL